MPTTDSTAVLNRVLAMLRESFPQFLRYARPHVTPQHEAAIAKLTEMAAAEDALAERIGEQVMAAGGIPSSGEFHMDFTDTHDLGVDYLIREAIGYQQQSIAELEKLSATPDLAPVAQMLVGEAIDLAKCHLVSLKELQAQTGASTIVRNNGAPVYKND